VAEKNSTARSGSRNDEIFRRLIGQGCLELRSIGSPSSRSQGERAKSQELEATS
jgi:hypothetical protein